MQGKVASFRSSGIRLDEWLDAKEEVGLKHWEEELEGEVFRTALDKLDWKGRLSPHQRRII